VEILCKCGKVFGSSAKNITSIIVRELCSTIQKHLKPLMILKLTKNKIKEITIGFKNLHIIPYTLSAINGSHMLIIAPKVELK
jgi:hypothetical protein